MVKTKNLFHHGGHGEHGEMKEGQRWISQAEPELGLGKIIEVKKRHVTILFPASEVVRQYAISSAPIQRIRFHEGDRVYNQDGLSFTVTHVHEEDGILIYFGDDHVLPETHLSDVMTLDSPEDRFKANQIDQNHYFDLRSRTLFLNHLSRSSTVRGFIGGRIDLIPHQFFIAREVTRRKNPRVLLSDETGLGKTIEACLIMHRLILNGRVDRVLILLPEPLVNQWFVELFRRFNLVFKIYDEATCRAIEKSQPGSNPFLEDQLMITSIDFIDSKAKRAEELMSVPWDLLIVDEAHHFQEDTTAYQILEALAKKTKHLLLLTATPEQLGFRSHFARIRLLDPARYDDLEKFRKEMKNYHHIAEIAGQLLDKPAQCFRLKKELYEIMQGSSGEYLKVMEQAFNGDEAALERLLTHLMDLHGVGRAILRNTRRIIKRFPQRKAHLIPLSSQGLEHHLTALSEAFASETLKSKEIPGYHFENDPRIKWLSEFLKKNRLEKVLLICRNVEKVSAIQTALEKIIRVKSALFHERLSLIQRDRNAAWFAESEGAQVLICSEIGSEGRNFQFARYMVLFDLPLNPELLEQRIGRLDRIGQKSTIHIYIPFISGSVQEVMARWYHDGLDAVENNIPGGSLIKDKFGEWVKGLAISFHEMDHESKDELNQLIKETHDYKNQVANKLEQGRDRLLEMSSFRQKEAREIIDRITCLDQDDHLENYMLKVFNYFGIEVESIGGRTHILKPRLSFNEAFHWIKQNKVSVTFDRSTSLVREDLIFLSWDHPMVLGAMEMLMVSEKGNCAFASIQDGDKQSIVIEAVFMLESVAPVHLHPDRFLPPTPIHIFVNHKMKDVTEEFNDSPALRNMKDLSPEADREKIFLLRKIIPDMMIKARELAESRSSDIIKKGLDLLKNEMGGEMRRLQELSRINPNIRSDEIEIMAHEKELLHARIKQSRLRLDAMRVIMIERNESRC